jgi:hypothetical protein
VWPAGLPPGTEPPKIGADKIARMTANDVPAFVTEDFMPPPNELKFRVVFIYSEETFENDPVKYWRKFGKKEYDRMEGFINKRKELEAELAQIVSPNDTPEMKLQKIYARVDQLRNLSFETRKSEEEEKRDKLKIPENAADVMKLGYGTGYGITWTFLGLARAAGLDAHGLMISRRSEYFFDEKRMDSKELDSNAVLVKLNGKDLYFDPGAKFVPYALLPWQESGVGGMSEVHIARTVRSDLFLIPQPNYAALRSFFQAVRSGDEQQIVLQPSAVAASH